MNAAREVHQLERNCLIPRVGYGIEQVASPSAANLSQLTQTALTHRLEQSESD
jgi:hypothetical protein